MTNFITNQTSLKNTQTNILFKSSQNEVQYNNKQINKQRKIKEINIAAQKVEAFFISYLLKEMRQSITSGGFIPKSLGEKIFEDFLDEKYAEDMVKNKQAIGLGQIFIERYRIDQQ